jgi:hypothetical protein
MGHIQTNNSKSQLTIFSMLLRKFPKSFYSLLDPVSLLDVYDLFFHCDRFCKESGFTTLKTSTFLSIAKVYEHDNECFNILREIVCVCVLARLFTRYLFSYFHTWNR